MDIKIDKNIEMPIKGRRGKTPVWSNLLKTMEVGDSFIAPSKKHGCVAVAAKRIGYSITSRKVDENNRRYWLFSKGE